MRGFWSKRLQGLLTQSKMNWYISSSTYNTSIYTSAHKGSLAKSCTGIRTKRQIGMDTDWHSIERWRDEDRATKTQTNIKQRHIKTNGKITDVHKKRKKNLQLKRHKDRCTQRQIYTKTDFHKDRLSQRQTFTKTDFHKDRLSQRQTFTKTDGHTHRWT